MQRYHHRNRRKSRTSDQNYQCQHCANRSKFISCAVLTVGLFTQWFLCSCSVLVRAGNVCVNGPSEELFWLVDNLSAELSKYFWRMQYSAK